MDALRGDAGRADERLHLAVRHMDAVDRAGDGRNVSRRASNSGNPGVPGRPWK